CSSRRRHTRFSRDWSSDVCSSDLVLGDTTGTPLSFAEIKIAGKQQFMLTDKHGYFKVNNVCPGNNAMQCDYIGYKSLNFNVFLRSEERRVGKECRYRWKPVHDKRN